MPRVTFTAQDLVLLHLRGEPRAPDPEKGLPRCPDDGGLTGRLCRWLADSGITVARTFHCGGGEFVGMLYPEDAVRVVEWLVQQGASGTRLVAL